jgi:hypothetical protein
MPRERFADVLMLIQEEQQSFLDELEGVEDGVGVLPQAQRAAPRPSRPVVEYKDLFKREPCAPERTVGISRTIAADAPSQRSVWEAVKAAAAAEVVKVQALAGAETAPCKTAVKFTVHGADITVFAGVDEVLNLLADEYIEGYCGFTGDDPRAHFEHIGSARRYGDLFKGPGGIFVKGSSKVGPDHVSIELKGEVFDLYGMAPFQRLMQRFNEMQLRWHLTRVDMAFDGVPFTPRKVFKAIERGHVRSLAQRDTLTEQNTPFGDEAGKTTYFGKRGSADFLRVYDRRKSGTRIEHECRKHRAKWIGLILMSAPIDTWHYVALGELRDFLDFVRVKEGENVTRASGKLVPWWSEFIGQVQRSTVKMGDVLKGFREQAELTAGRVAGVVKNISRRVNLLRDVLGDAEFLSLFDRFRERENGADRVRVKEVGQVLRKAAELCGQSISEIISAAAGLKTSGSSDVLSWFRAEKTATIGVT